MRRTYLDGLRRAHEVAMGTLPFPCGDKKKRSALLRMGAIMGITIKAIEDEIKRETAKS